MTNRRKRLAIIGIRGFPGVQGGVESHCLQLIPRLAGKFDCRVYRRRPYLTEDSAKSVPEGITFTDLPSTRIGGFESLWHTFLCCMHLLMHRVDVVNIHNIGPGLFAPLLRIMGFKVVLTYHSPNYEHDKWSLPAKLLLRLCEKISLGCSNRIIFVSEPQRSKYSDRVKRKSLAIPNGINAIGSDHSTDFLKQHGLEPDKYILAVGRLTPEKGFDVLIRAVNVLEEPVTLVIAGASDHGDSYEKQLRALDVKNRTVFTGFTTGAPLAQLYTHARMYVLSSRAEGFPMVLLEAMSHRLPVVCSDIPAARIIPLASDRYAPVGDAETLAHVISKVLGTAPEREDYDLTAYDWNNVAETTAQLYKSLF